MNRVTRILHKARFLKRHLSGLAYSHKYVITADDVIRHDEAAQERKKNQKTGVELVQMINDVLDGFDPDNNLWDRVMFHDITGQMIIEGEF